MSYTLPSATAADLQFEGAYTAPSSTAADLSFVSGNPASSLGPTALFGSPVAAYARTQAATGIAPTTQLPTPRGLKGLPVTGFCSTQFGTGTGTKQQRPTGFLAGVLGTPRVFPYSPPPIRSTQFGTGRLFPYHVAPGIHSTQFGPINGWQHWDEVWNPPATKFGTPTTPTNRTAQAAGFQSTRYGQPSKVSHKQDGESWLCIASGFDPVRISSPVATWPQSGSVSGIAAGHLGTPKGARGQRATGIHSTVIGAPTVKTMLKAYGFASSHLGLAVAVMTQRAAGARFSQRFGIPESDIGNTHKVYGINASGRIGNPSGFSRFNYLVTGFRPVAIGSASCHESHRVSHVTPICRLGTPTLKRNTQC